MEHQTSESWNNGIMKGQSTQRKAKSISHRGHWEHRAKAKSRRLATDSSKVSADYED